MQHSGIAESSKHVTPSQMALYHPGCFLQKVLPVKAPRDLYTLAMSRVSYKERTKTTMVIKNWTSKVRISRFPNNDHQAFLLTNREISQEKISSFKKKMHVAILSKVD
jgi:predicted nucleotidyltransferase component of viral defense system